MNWSIKDVLAAPRASMLMRLARCGRSSAPKETALALSLAAHALIYAFVGAASDAENGAASGDVVPAAPSSLLAVKLEREGINTRLAQPVQARTESPKPHADVRAKSQPPLQKQTVKPVFAIAAPAVSYYFPASELTHKPVVVRDISPDLARSFYGVPPQSVRLVLQINEAGEVDHVKVEDSVLPEHAERIILEAFRETRFLPGRIGAEPVKTELKVQMAIELIEPVLGQPASAT